MCYEKSFLLGEELPGLVFDLFHLFLGKKFFFFLKHFHFEEIKVFKAGLFFGHEYAQHGMEFIWVGLIQRIVC